MRPSFLAAAAAATALVVGACGGPSAKSTSHPLTAADLLAKAHTAVDAASAVHFELTSKGIPKSGQNLTGGKGDLARPDELQGSFDVSFDGVPVTVKAIAVGGKFYAELPFTTSYRTVNPSQFGLGDPAGLLNPKTGVASLLTQVQKPQLGAQERINGELLDQVSGTVAGKAIAPFLPDARPSTPVSLDFAINPSSGQVRRVDATGPFASATTNSTYTLTLTGYGEKVTITAPK